MTPTARSHLCVPRNRSWSQQVNASPTITEQPQKIGSETGCTASTLHRIARNKRMSGTSEVGCFVFCTSLSLAETPRRSCLKCECNPRGSRRSIPVP